METNLVHEVLIRNVFTGKANLTYFEFLQSKDANKRGDQIIKTGKWSIIWLNCGQAIDL